MRNVIILLALALISIPVYADVIELSFNINDVDQWAASRPEDTSSGEVWFARDRRPGPLHGGGMATWNGYKTTTTTWSPSFVSVQINRRDAAGNSVAIRSGSFQVREDTVSAITSLQGDLNGLYVNLADKQAEIQATLGQVGTYLYAPANDNPHPDTMDTLLTKERERIAIESEIAQKTEAIRTETGSGLPGWDGDVTVTETWYEN